MFQRLEGEDSAEDQEFRSEDHMRAEEALVGLQFLQASSIKVVACMIIRHARVKASTRTNACCHRFDIKSCQIQVKQLIENRGHPLIPLSSSAPRTEIAPKLAAWVKYYSLTHVESYDMRTFL